MNMGVSWKVEHKCLKSAVTCLGSSLHSKVWYSDWPTHYTCLSRFYYKVSNGAAIDCYLMRRN